MTSTADDREASNRLAAERETLRRHHQAERQREAREREYERRWRLHL
ncbi:MAG: hypothetical protein AB7G37_16825 [Solirubrobacteraceae bacterium]